MRFSRLELEAAMSEQHDDCLAGCTPAQVEAISHPGGPLLVLAGAGSGKTRVITRRIAWLIRNGTAPWDILAITFTNKAADEMRGRVIQLCGPECLEGGLWVSTFHSMCARILRHHADKLGYARDFSIYDSSDSLGLIRRLMKNLDISTEYRQPRVVASTISNLKNRLVSPREPDRRDNPFDREAHTIYRAYQKALKENQAMDFDDLLLKVVELFQKTAEVKERYARRFRHILVDEYQDTNHAQYRIAASLADVHRNICVTGDPDQSIYGWRGADISNILEFERQYPDAKVIVLDKNYRSTQVILGAANSLISNNELRKPKELRTDNPRGVLVRVFTLADENAEAKHVAADIAQRAKTGLSFNDFAVFYRTNAQSRSLETALSEAGIPYQVVAGVSFFDRREVKDIIAYLRVCANPADDEAVDRILNVPPRELGKASREKLLLHARRKGIHLSLALATPEAAGLSGRQAEGAKRLHMILKAVRAAADKPVAEQLKLLFADTGYRRYLNESFADAEDRIANCDELLNVAAQHDSQGDDRSLTGFLERVALASNQDALDRDRGAVKLMTLHTAKGLEFNIVYITGLEEGLLPLETDDRDLEEERRLSFVGLTRAKNEVTLTLAATRRRYGQITYPVPSRFLEEIAQELVERESLLEEAAPGVPSDEKAYIQVSAGPRDVSGLLIREGDRVIHGTFGAGTVVGFSGSGERAKAVVRFPGVGQKNLVLKYARLEKVV